MKDFICNVECFDLSDVSCKVCEKASFYEFYYRIDEEYTLPEQFVIENIEYKMYICPICYSVYIVRDITDNTGKQWDEVQLVEENSIWAKERLNQLLNDY